MTDVPDRPAPEPAPDAASDPDKAGQFARLRALLVGREQREIAELRDSLDAQELSPDNLAEQLPEAIARRAGRDDQLARALGPTLETAFGESVRRNPQQIAEAIYPALGPAIRKAIAEAIAGLVTAINRSVESSLSVQGIKWRFEAWRSGVPYAHVVMKHALVYRVEQAYLIDAETGLLLAHVTAPDLSAPNADVISGMLTAIRDFVRDSFDPDGAGGLRTFSVGDVTVLVEAGPRALLAAVVRGQHPPALLERLQETLELIHLRLAGPLADFDGDTSPFAPAEPLLAACLETVVETDRPGVRGLVPRIVWVVAAVVLVTLVAAWSARSRRDQRAIRALADEPGIVLLEQHRGLRTWRIRGLRDPLAAAPGAVLAAAGMDSARVRTEWTPYLSVEPTMMQARAGRLLNPPPTTTLSVRGDTLVAEGTAPTDWIDAARARWPAIAGAAAWRDAGVAARVPTALAGTVASVRASRVLFAAGSAALPSSAGPALRAVTTAYRAVRAGVGAEWAVTLEIVGRTDTTGSREANRLLSDERADAVVRALADLGIPAAALNARGIGASDPLPATADENRSVSFDVRVAPARLRAEVTQ